MSTQSTPPITPLMWGKDVEARLAALEAENRRLSADASWAATHRSELADLRDAFAKTEARLKAAEKLAETMEALVANAEPTFRVLRARAALAAYRESAR